MLGECSFSSVDEILVDGLSWSIDVDTEESAKSTALGAAATGTEDTAIVGGLKYSSNIDTTEQSRQPVMTREEDDEIYVALDPQAKSNALSKAV
nr:hypothetical protein [Tanacetum cinerariifolium]